jgi:hypothetical protein
VDMWRELCWRYLVFPGQYGDRETGEREAEVVFAVFLRLRRPLIHAALVDAATGNPVQWPAAPKRAHWLSPAFRLIRPVREILLQERRRPPGQLPAGAGESDETAPETPPDTGAQRSAAFY